MSKSVFILETPKVCFGCGCIFAEAGTYGGLYCKALRRFCEEPFHHKEKDCPLKELPERRRYGEEFFNGDVKGWNDCLKEILGE